MSVHTPLNDEIARVAHAIWEAEGQPEGRDHEHWMRARRLIEEGRAEIKRAEENIPRPVQPGFEDAAPGMVPAMTPEPFEDVRDGAGGRFASQLSELPEDGAAASRTDATGRPAADAPDAPRSPATAPKRRRSRQVATPGR